MMENLNAIKTFQLALRFGMALGPTELERKEAFVIPIFARGSGMLLAVPTDFLPQDRGLGCRIECKFNGGCRSFDYEPMSWSSRDREW